MPAGARIALFGKLSREDTFVRKHNSCASRKDSSLSSKCNLFAELTRGSSPRSEKTVRKCKGFLSKSRKKNNAGNRRDEVPHYSIKELRNLLILVSFYIKETNERNSTTMRHNDRRWHSPRRHYDRARRARRHGLEGFHPLEVQRCRR